MLDVIASDLSAVALAKAEAKQSPRFKTEIATACFAGLAMTTP
jgi:hypothetical protein